MGATVDCPFDLESELIDQAHPVEPILVTGSTTIRGVLDIWREQGQGVVLVVKDERLEGIFTERDVLRFMIEKGSLDQPIEKVMKLNPVTVLAGDNIAVAVDKMSGGGYRRLPVVDEQGRPQGLLVSAGILRFLVEHFPNAVYTLPPAPKVVMQEREGA